MTQPRVLLVLPGHIASPVWGYRAFPAQLHALYSALAPSCELTVLDLDLELGAPAPEAIEDWDTRMRSLVGAQQWDVALISCWTSLNVPATWRVARYLRETDATLPIAVGGYHVSACPEEFLGEDSSFTFVVTGEAESVAHDIITGRIESNGAPQLLRTPSTATDSPPPLWDGFPYTRATGFTGNIGMYLSRGCPFKCSFCVEPVKGQSWRAVAPDRAVELVTDAVRVNGPGQYLFFDPLFGFDSHWLAAFLDALETAHAGSSLFDGVTYWAEMRTDIFNRDILDALARLKFAISFGLESTSGVMLKRMHKTSKPEKYLSRFQELSQALDDRRVHHQTFMIYNHPGETPETLEESFAWIDHLLAGKRDTYLTLSSQAYAHFPGSPLAMDFDTYARQFGARILFPGWWRDEIDHHGRATAVIPSAALVKAGQMHAWKNKFYDVLTNNERVAAAANQPGVHAFRQQFAALNLS